MSAAFTAPLEGGEVTKTYTLAGRALQVTYRLRNVPSGRFTVVLNLAMPSCDGYAGRYILADGSIPCGFGQALDLAASQGLTLDDRVLGGGLRLAASRPVALSARPHYTVSQSEAGFEKIMQAACLTLSWPIDAVSQELTISLGNRRGRIVDYPCGCSAPSSPASFSATPRSRPCCMSSSRASSIFQRSGARIGQRRRT
jgi:hypothetical protein